MLIINTYIMINVMLWLIIVLDDSMVIFHQLKELLHICLTSPYIKINHSYKHKLRPSNKSSIAYHTIEDINIANNSNIYLHYLVFVC